VNGASLLNQDLNRCSSHARCPSHCVPHAVLLLGNCRKSHGHDPPATHFAIDDAYDCWSVQTKHSPKSESIDNISDTDSDVPVVLNS
jgi:hypothetical protein